MQILFPISFLYKESCPTIGKLAWDDHWISASEHHISISSWLVKGVVWAYIPWIGTCFVVLFCCCHMVGDALAHDFMVGSPDLALGQLYYCSSAKEPWRNPEVLGHNRPWPNHSWTQPRANRTHVCFNVLHMKDKPEWWSIYPAITGISPYCSWTYFSTHTNIYAL